MPQLRGSSTWQRIHDSVASNGLEYSVMVGDGLVDMHAKSRSIKIKVQVFDTFSFKDVASWNAVIEGCSYNQYSDKA